MIQTQKKIFRILTGFNLVMILVVLVGFLMVFAIGGVDEFNQIFTTTPNNEIIFPGLLLVAWVFVFYKMYTFKKIGMNLYVPMLIIVEFISWYLWEPYDVDDRVLLLADLITAFDYFTSGLLFALMFLTNMKKEFQ